MKKETKKNVILLLLLVGFAGIIALIYTYPRTVTNFIEPLRNEEEVENIRIIHEKFENPYIVEIKDFETISRIKKQLEKVRVRYWRRDDAVLYSEDNYLLVVQFNDPDQKIILQKDGKVYWDNKQYFPVDDQSKVLFELLEQISEETD